jgi:phage/plasmid-like protein (TIGR03299 family)
MTANENPTQLRLENRPSGGVAIIRGQPAMMFTGEIPWEGLGTQLSAPATAAEAIAKAGLNWRVVKVPVSMKRGRRHVPIENRFAVVREDQLQAKAPVALGIVGKLYEPLQNQEAFAWFDPIVGRGAAVYHAAGAVGNGEHVWILAKLPGELRIAGDDVVEKFLLLNNSHDGSSSVRARFTPIRVFCANSLMIPTGSGNRLRVKHTSRVREQMELATLNLGIIERSFGEVERRLQALARVPLHEGRLTEYLRAVFPEPGNPKDVRAMTYVAKARSQSRFLFDQGTGNRESQVRGSLWAAYNGVTEFVDYNRHGTGANAHLDSIWFGGGCYTKARAYRIAVERARFWMN